MYLKLLVRPQELGAGGIPIILARSLTKFKAGFLAVVPKLESIFAEAPAPKLLSLANVI